MSCSSTEGGRALQPVEVIGSGPAGSSAAIAARMEGAQVCLVDRSRFPRHKVCGEFFSPEIAPLLDTLGVWERFAGLRPSRIRRMALHFRRWEKVSTLPEPAYGLSRYRFDQLLRERAIELGAECASEAGARRGGARVIAWGRRGLTPGGAKDDRLFGFKAHFQGPVDDAVELFFFDGCYAGVSAVEAGATNVCGLGPLSRLRACAFDVDALLRGCPALSARLAPLARIMAWIMVGPLIFGHSLRTPNNAGLYVAGDALSFVDPFTGSGLLAAVLTGSEAGKLAARDVSAEIYVRRCRRMLERPFEAASLFRRVLASGWADRLARIVPARLLYTLTRPCTAA